MAGERSTFAPAAAASGEAYRMLVEHANDGIAVVQDARFVFGNPSVVAMSGRSADEFVGLHISQVFHPEDLPAAIARFVAGAESNCDGSPAPNTGVRWMIARSVGW